MYLFRESPIRSHCICPPPHLVFVLIRMGFAYANEHIIQYMNNVKAPYNVNRLSQEVAVRALADRTLYQERVTAILKVCVRRHIYFRVFLSRDKAKRGFCVLRVASYGASLRSD